MKHPYPSRRSIHHAKGGASAQQPVEQTGEDGAEDQEPKQLPKRCDRHSDDKKKASKRARRRKLPTISHQAGWTIGVGVVGAIVAGVLLFFGFVGSRALDQDVLTVEGPLDAVTVAGRQGSTPVVTTTVPVEVASAKMRVELRGDGREITEGSPILVAVTAYSGETGENINPMGTPNLILGTASEEDLGPLLSRILIGTTEGSRVVIARPLEDGQTEIDVVDVLYTIARGALNEEPGGPLTVTFDDLGPAVTHAPGAPPSGLIIQVLNQGSGPQVALTDSVVLQYISGTWTDGRITGSTWATGTPEMIRLEDAMPGLRDALVDQRVGSRLALTIPADMATGEDTLFMVVDILGAMPASEASGTVGEQAAESGE
ncbi:FKBP-type peptidyl-prolyl cis-trans isomerase [Actinomyces minihominis]|uniref:FKBP-type peptidyl-prolyl cis-trans isomerase n=1 Tax=Actinomyces minihominis TaxID=2002838 RepID=UPI000C079571|nr:peptidylprolyl isomerase [Actinomyces minihominis]